MIARRACGFILLAAVAALAGGCAVSEDQLAIVPLLRQAVCGDDAQGIGRVLTPGAVVGQQPFGGARGSGTNDKAGSKLNLVRWASARTSRCSAWPSVRNEVHR